MSTEKQIRANRRNAKKAKGPNDTTTWNAITGLTELDDIEAYERILADLTLLINPVGPVEECLVRSAALDLTRWKRA